MMFWKRKSKDPLLRMFLDKYHLNLLSVPREKAEVGDLYVYDGKRASAPGKISFFLNEPIEMPEVREGEIMADITGTLSHGVAFKVGFGLLEGFLTALGASGIVTKVRVGFEKEKTSQIKYRFARTTRDSVDILQMGVELIGKKLKEKHPLYREDHSYFLVTGVARTPSISIVAEGKDGQAVNLDLQALKIGEISPSVSVEKTGEGETTFSGEKSLAFGVELLKLLYDPEENRIKLEMQSDEIKLMHNGQPTKPMVGPAFIGGEQDDAFIVIE